MNRGLWLVRKNYLICLMKKVSSFYGGDDEFIFNEECKDVIDRYSDEKIEQVILVYQQCLDRLKYINRDFRFCIRAQVPER